MDACTIIARNYLAYARVLARSFREHHPQGRFTVLVVDTAPSSLDTAESFTALTLYDIGLPRDEVHRMAAIYDVKELATAVKPFLLKRLLADGADAVVYFDPDIEIFAPLDDVAALAIEHGVVLTPHVTSPMARNDGLLPDERMIMRAGIYNLGFIAVGSKATPFLDWWGEHLSRDCIVDVENGLFVDQRWIDFVPALFDHAILRDPAFNVAYWNLDQRTLRWTGQAYEVDGRPLRFFHFSGYSADRDHLVSAHMGEVPRVRLDGDRDLRRLYIAYAARLRDEGFGHETDGPYRFGVLPGGLRLDGPTRRVIRQAILEAERAGELVPDPFGATTGNDFLEWLREHVDGTPVSRYLDALHRSRGDLRAEFPDHVGADRERFLDWAAAAVDRRELSGAAIDVPRRIDQRRAQGKLRRLARRHAALRRLVALYRRVRRANSAHVRRSALSERQSSRPIVASSPPLPGVNVAGYFRAELGVGEAARRLVSGLEAGGIPHATVTYDRTVSRQAHPYVRSGSVAPFDMNIVCVNADELPGFRHDVGSDFFRGRYTVGLWFWEVGTFPERFHTSFDLVDEVWVGSEFVREAISPCTDKPVCVVPLPIEPLARPTVSRLGVGFPDDRFVFFFSFDFLSVFERKNPLGLIDAFDRAFRPLEGPVLVVKSINGDRDSENLRVLRERAADRPDIVVRDGYVSAEERDAMAAHCDCYVSLHRSEGFGLTMAEAMAAGKPVIATGYSGNVAFMDERNSHLVPYRLSPIPAHCGPYPSGAEWADPDVSRAAELMRGVWERQDQARTLGRRAQQDILRANAPARTTAFVRKRLSEIREERPSIGVERRGDRPPGAALIDAPGRWPTRFARRVLHRLLWPYLAEREAFEAAVAAVLRSQASFDGLSGQARLGDRGGPDLGADIEEPEAEREFATRVEHR